MREITRLMINEFKLKKLGMDFMGFRFDRKGASYHHTIIPRRNCKALGLGEGYFRWNGSILIQDTSHDFLHTIENYDYERFLAITSELIEQNLLGRLDRDCLVRIHDILASFEREYQGKRTKKGVLIVKPEYVQKRLVLKNNGGLNI